MTLYSLTFHQQFFRLKKSYSFGSALYYKYGAKETLFNLFRFSKGTLVAVS